MISGVSLVSLVTGEATRPIRHKQQQCYLVCIQEIDDGSEFYIVEKNFKVETPPPPPYTLPEQDASGIRRAYGAHPYQRAGAPVLHECDLQHRGWSVTCSDKGRDRGAAESGALRSTTTTSLHPRTPSQIAPQGNAPPPGTWEKQVYCPPRANASFSDQMESLTIPGGMSSLTTTSSIYSGCAFWRIGSSKTSIR